jgi:hypothetical protein
MLSMSFDIKKYETLLNDTQHLLTCMDCPSPTMTPKESSLLHHSNHCLLWLYTTHLQGHYSRDEIDFILCLVKTVLLPRLHSLSDPHHLSYVDLTRMLRVVMSKVNF